MNFPIPSDGKYLLTNYFSHYEAEHRVLSAKAGHLSIVWEKKNSNAQNHFWDVRVYNMALRDVVVKLQAQELKLQRSFTWKDFVDLTLGRYR
jgi:hypothetical protein